MNFYRLSEEYLYQVSQCDVINRNIIDYIQHPVEKWARNNFKYVLLNIYELGLHYPCQLHLFLKCGCEYLSESKYSVSEEQVYKLLCAIRERVKKHCNNCGYYREIQGFGAYETCYSCQLPESNLDFLQTFKKYCSDCKEYRKTHGFSIYEICDSCQLTVKKQKMSKTVNSRLATFRNTILAEPKKKHSLVLPHFTDSYVDRRHLIIVSINSWGCYWFGHDIGSIIGYNTNEYERLIVFYPNNYT